MPRSVPQKSFTPPTSLVGRALPSVFAVGKTQLSVAEPLAVATTLIANAGSELVALPSLTLIVMAL